MGSFEAASKIAMMETAMISMHVAMIVQGRLAVMAFEDKILPRGSWATKPVMMATESTRTVA